MTDAFSTLKSRLAEISDLRRVGGLLFWDQQTMMSPAGAPIRADQLATINRMAHELFVSDEIGRLLAQASSEIETLDPESDEACIVRVTREDCEKARRVPPALRAEMTRASSQGLQAWVGAKAKADFAVFLPALERNVELKRRVRRLLRARRGAVRHPARRLRARHDEPPRCARSSTS